VAVDFFFCGGGLGQTSLCLIGLLIVQFLHALFGWACFWLSLVLSGSGCCL